MGHCYAFSGTVIAITVLVASFHWVSCVVIYLLHTFVMRLKNPSLLKVFSNLNRVTGQLLTALDRDRARSSVQPDGALNYCNRGICSHRVVSGMGG